MYEKEFVKRLIELRMQKGVSARDMSLSIGQSESYINKIENGVSLPSLSVFFYICEYFGITPEEFFDKNNKCPDKLKAINDTLKGLNAEQLEHLHFIAKDITRKQ